MSDAVESGGSAEYPETRPEEYVPPPVPDGLPPVPSPDPNPLPPDLNREVEEAMGAMDPNDLAELCGGTPDVESGEPAEGIEPGTELTGTVVGVSEDEVFIEFGPKSQGFVPRSQFGKKEVVENGRRVDVVVERYDADASMLILNRKGAVQRATWTNLSVGAIVQGRATGMNKGGLEIDLNGIRAFMPASQVDNIPMKDISVFLNESLRCEVVEVDRRGKNVLVSRRKLMERESAEAKAKLKTELAVGQVRKGIVGTITDYGAFIDLGGIDGLLHIRDLSWGSVEKVTDVLTEGQEIDVQILKIDAERDRISLGAKQCQPDPWVGAEEKYPAGTL